MTNLYSSWGSGLKTRQALRAILFLFSFCCFSILGHSQSYADLISGESGIVNSSFALNAADGAGAQFYENGDVLTLQLDATVPTGTPYYITWRKRTGEAGNARPVVRESANGGSWTDNPVLTQSSSTSFVTIAYTAQCDINYFQITKNSAVPADFEIDAITTLQYDDCATIVGGCNLVGFETSSSRIFWIPSFGTDFKASGSIGLTLTKYSDGTAHLSGLIERIGDSTKKFVVKVWFNNESDYSSWISQGNIAHSPNLGDEASWMFYDFDMSKTNQLIGIDGQETLRLNIYPQVSNGTLDLNTLSSLNQASLSGSNFQYGFQLGQGANAQDGDFGASAWFVYDGTNQGNGDINSNLASCWDNNVCYNVTNGGTIGSDQTGSAPYDVALLSSITSASGGSGTTEYVWMYRNATTSWNMVAIENSNSPSFDPGSICETTIYRRCSKKVNCSSWDGESNDITITVNGSCATCNNVTSGGTIGSNQTGCGPFDPAAITNIAWPTGGSGNIEYMWLYKNASTSWNLVTIDGASAASYDPTSLTETTHFRRCARRAGCTSWNGESNDVIITVNACCDNVTNGGEIGYNQSGCAPYDPTAFVSISLPSGGSGAIEYIWMFKNASTGWNFWTISGANGPTYDAGPVGETTYFRRCARRSGCTSWDGETNDVIVTITTDNVPPVFTNVPADETVECAEGIPAVVTPTVNDNIDTTPTITFSSDTIVNGMSSTLCEITDADSHTLYISGAVASALGVTNPNFTSVTPGQFELFADGSLKMTGIVQSVQNANKKFEYTAWFKSQRNWTEWSSIPNSSTGSGFREAKLDAGTSVNITDEYLDWSYYEQDASKPNQLVGLGDLAGVNLTISHYPANLQFGGQLGDKGSLQSIGYGFSAWIWIEGSINGTNVAAQGDFNVDLNNCEETNTELNCGSEYQIIRTWTASDDCGNQSTASQTITVIGDTQDPTFDNLPENGTVACGDLPTPNDFNVTASDNCDNDVTVTVTFEDQGSTEGCNYTRVFTWTAIDDCGNMVVETRSFSTLDNTNPTFNNLPENQSVACGSLPTIQDLNVSASDNCDTSVVVEGSSQDNGSGCNYTRTFTWVATDDCGNSITATRTYTIYDNIDPIFTTVPNSGNYDCGQMPVGSNFVVAASDNCDDNVTITSSFEDAGTGCNTSRTITWVATDVCGNSASVSVTFYSSDEVDPIINNVPSNSSVECGTMIEDLMLTATDNCDQNVTVTVESYTTPYGCGEVFVRTWTATDDCGNVATATQSINIVDTTAPTISSEPADATYSCDAQIPYTEPVFADICDAQLDVQFTTNNVANGCSYDMVREWTATDDCGNFVKATQIIHIIDTTAPSIMNVPADETVSCDNVPAPSTLVYASDICDSDVSVVYSEVTNTFNCGYDIVRTWTATDDCGNTSSASQTVHVTDTTNPTLVNMPADAIASCDDVPAAATNVTANDNCDSSVSVIYSESIVDGPSVDGVNPCGYAIYRTWTATDDCGNIASATQVVTVIDNVAPVLVGVPANTSAECASVPAAPTVTAYDNCFDGPLNVVLTENIVPMGACSYQIVRTWTVADNCLNVATATQTITVTDNTNPVFVNAPADATVECGQVPSAASVTAIDACDTDVTVDYFEYATTGCPYTIIRTWVASDDCGNTTVHTQNVTVVDTTAPVVDMAPASEITVECDEEAPVVNVTFTDACDTDVYVSAISGIANVTDCGYDVQRSWTATDDCGNSTTVSQVVHFIDTTAPVFVNVPSNTTVSCDAIPAPAQVSATDNCSTATVSMTQTMTEGCSYTITRTWTATDACGNAIEASQVITVIDEVDPIIHNVPAGITVECGDEISAASGVYATDNCDNDVTLTYVEETGSGFCTHYLVRTWTATDNCGNTATATQTITLVDTTDPTLVGVPANVTVECTSIPAVATVSAIDNCSENLDVNFIEETLAQDCGYLIVRTWSVHDECNNTTMATQIITVTDTTDPIATYVPATISVECDEVIPYTVATFGDNCDTNVSVVASDSEVANGCSYDVIRTWVATDDCGNTASASQTIHIIDTTSPFFVSVPADITVECDNVPAFEEATASDNCSDVTISYNETSVPAEIMMGMPCGEIITRTWTATDDCGNSTTVSQVIHFVDTTNPVFTSVPSNETVQCSAIPAPAVVTAIDNCSEVQIMMTSSIVEVDACSYILVRTWTATDACGNDVSYTQELNVVDTTNPTLNGVPANATVACDNVPAAAIVYGMDNCDEQVAVSMIESATEGCPYTITRTWTGVDNCGNTVSATQVLTVVDEVAPVLYGVPADVTISCTEEVSEAIVIAQDNCTNNIIVTLTAETTPAECGATMIRTWTASDACGNEVVATQVVTIVDILAPYIVTGVDAELTVECSDEVPFMAPSFGDLCDEEVEVTFVSGFNNVSPCGYDIERVWTAMDNCGNETSVSQVVHVVDTTAPVFASTPANVTVACDAIPAPAQLTAIDNCSGVNVSYNETATEGCPYTITRTWTATDECGNATSYSQVLTVIDEVAPIIHNVPMGITVECGDQPATVVGVYATDNCDNDVELTYTEVTGSGYCTTYVVRTWTAVDNCGNESSATQTITFVDTTAPVFEGEDEVLTLECNMQASIIAPSAYDICDSQVDVEMTSSNTPGDCANSWTEVYTWTATDDCGNTAVRTLTINYIDTTAPEFTYVPADATVECDNVPAIGVATATDNCDNEVTVTVSEEVTEGCPYTITRTWVATDNCGNYASATQVLTVVDTTLPILMGVPSNTSILCTDNLPNASVYAIDNCDLDVVVTMTQSTEVLSCGEVVTRTWTATDNCGNVATATQIIEVVDIDAPVVVSQPASDITVMCDEVIPFEAPVFDDFCSGVENVDYNEEVIGNSTCSYDIVRTWVASDYCGNETEVVQTIHVIDTVDPILVGVPANETVECNEVPAAAIVTATDNCADDLIVTLIEDEIAQDCGYLLVRSWTVHDNCGNTANATQIITVVDTQAPVLSGENQVLNLECNMQASVIAPTVEDNCDANVEVVFESTTIEGECENSWTEVYSWTATDNCGNEAVRTLTINYSDNTAPVIENMPADMNIECGNAIPAASTEVFGSDNCDNDVTVTMTETEVALACGYQIVREYIAIDNCGNTSTETQTITIVDSTAPTFNQTVENLDVNCSDVPSVPTINANDNCDENVSVNYSETVGEGCPYVITRTWVATDDCGNESVLTQTISVTDEIAPVFDNVEPWIQMECDEVGAFMETASDNCDANVTVEIIEELLFSGSCMGNIQRTYQATDNCGNSTIAYQIIQIVDTHAPVISNVPAATTIYCGSELPAVPTDVFATDNCDVDVELTFTQTQTNEFCPYDVIRTWTAIDECGNETVVSQVIHVTVEIPAIVSFQTYPNPSNGDFTFEFSSPKDSKVYSAIYDVTGKEVMTLMNGQADSGRLYKFNVDGGRLNTGTYTVMINVDGEVMRSRMVITSK